MTPLHKAVARATDILHRGKNLVVKMTPEGIYIKGARERWTTAYLVPWQMIYDLGGKLRAMQLRAEKKARRKQR